MSWAITKQVRFEASHVLPEHDGKCARLHGHSWVADVTFKGYELQDSGPERGMLMDFGRIGSYLNPMVDAFLDHYHLNDSLGIYPTSENVAKWIYTKLMIMLPHPYASKLKSVTVHETCTCAATYEDEDM